MQQFFILIISLTSMVWAANHLVYGAAGLTAQFHFSPLWVGLSIVALGTTLPELAFSLFSAIKDNHEIAIGNAIGSNIANIGLVLGITILLRPNGGNDAFLKKTYPILIILMLFTYGLILDGWLSRADGCLILIACIVGLISFIYLINSMSYSEISFTKFRTSVFLNRSMMANTFSLILGLLILPVSARYFITTIAGFAMHFGMSETDIGLTIVAFGTTLPELVTAITAAVQGEEALAMGTILGSNLYNLLLLMALPSLINPIKINHIILARDVPVMIAFTLLIIVLNSTSKKKLSSWHGAILLLIYFSYLASVVIKSVSS